MYVCILEVHCAHELVFPKDAHKDVIRMFLCGIKIGYEKSSFIYEHTVESTFWVWVSRYIQNWGGQFKTQECPLKLYTPSAMSMRNVYFKKL